MRDGHSRPWRQALIGFGLSAATAIGATTYTPYADVRPILASLADVLPSDLESAASPDRAWDAWAARHDREIRTRLRRGDLDTIVNWLLLGTTFTSQPPAVFRDTVAEVRDIVVARAQDLVTALQSPGADERRLFARALLEDEGYGFGTSADRDRVAQYLLLEVARVAGEQAGFAREIASARRLGDTTAEFAMRSRVYRERGVSLDTSLMPGVAIERSLAELRRRGLVKPGQVRDVAVIGPGLDFSDKSSGYDFYPPQTLQPFMLLDSLVRVGLADAADAVRVTTLDLSERVNDHLETIRRRAARGTPYRVQLPLDGSVAWNAAVLTYWTSAGDRIGTAVPVAARGAGNDRLRVREITIRPSAVLQVHPEDVNIVVQRLTDRQFDLIVATNVFVYYDVLDQALALANVAAMLRPGGFLLSNNALLELPSSRLRSVDYLTVEYSSRPDDGDHVVWYQAR